MLGSLVRSYLTNSILKGYLVWYIGDVHEDRVESHYSVSGILEAIESDLKNRGKDFSALNARDLSIYDELHVGQRWATAHLFDLMNLGPGSVVLDVGCGLGGPARTAAEERKWRVTGVDLTAELISVALELTKWLKLSEGVEFKVCSATQMPFADCAFDAAYMIHVGMNLSDKESVFREVSRVLKSGGKFGIYDLMQGDLGPLEFPLPWANDEVTSFTEPVEKYEGALTAAGFEVVETVDRTEFAVEFFAMVDERMKAKVEKSGIRDVIMGDSMALKSENLRRAIEGGRLRPMEILAKKI